MKAKSNPKISVIMSVYNGLPHLKDAVKSILDQTYTNFEFIIIDDASEDGTWKYLQDLQDKRIRLLRNKKNLGLARSLNIALRQAQGDFIARMDADDISIDSRLEKQLNFLETNKEIDLCGSWVNLIDEKGKIVGEKKYPTNPEDIKKKLPLYNPIIHPSVMARRSFFDRLNGYREEYDGAEDYELLMRGKETFKYANLPQDLLLLRLSSSRRSIKSMSKMDKLDLKIKLDFIKENGLSPLGLYAVVKKLFSVILLPPLLKIEIAKFLKKA